VAYCWGMNTNGQVGDGSTTNRPAPVVVAGGLTLASLAAGGLHTCGVTSGGAAYCWGSGNLGQLGDGTGLDRQTPVAVVSP
jgi:alpha-tubulin suppressor-like RCC1 family protein